VDDGAVHRIHYRFGLVLCLIIAAVFVTMAAPRGDGGRFAAVVLQSGVLVAAVIASKAHPWIIRMSIVAAIAGVVGAAAALFGSGEFGDSSSGIVGFLYVFLPFPAIAAGVYRQFREVGTVTVQTMFGVLCLYLLLGLIFGAAYASVQDLSNTDFFTSHATAGRDDFLYFSYSTLTTVGYGDLVAAANFGRSLAISEALLGQVYLVTVVAVIVSRIERPQRSRT
jgi:ion channel